MAHAGKPIKASREENANVMRFTVEDADQAFAAILDVPRFYATGSLVTDTVTNTHASRDLEVFVITGFPVTHEPTAYTPRLDHGQPKSVGAVYSVVFPVGRKVVNSNRRKGEVTMVTEIIHLEDHPQFKEVRFQHRNIGKDVPELECDCFPGPLLVLPETETSVRIERNEDGDWEVRLSYYTDISALDPREREGHANYWTLTAITALLCPWFLPCVPCFIYDEFHVFPGRAIDQIRRVQAYCNTYDPSMAASPYSHEEGGRTGAARFQSGGRVGAKIAEEEERSSFQRIPDGRKVAEEVQGSRTNYDLAIPVAQVEPQQRSRTEELDRWYQLYKNGAISYAEYEAEKAKILSSV